MFLYNYINKTNDSTKSIKNNEVKSSSESYNLPTEWDLFSSKINEILPLYKPEKKTSKVDISNANVKLSVIKELVGDSSNDLETL